MISSCVWLYYTFPLSYRDIQKMMICRGDEVTYEAIRLWCRKIAQSYANPIRRQGLFHPHQLKLTADEYRETMSQKFDRWQEILCQDISA